MKRFLFPFILLLISATSLAQSGQPLRLELPATQYSDELKRVLCDSDGVCILYPSYKPDSITCHFAQYNTQLESIFDFKFTLTDEYDFSTAAYKNGTVGILYQQKNKKKFGTKGFLVRYDCRTHQWTKTAVHQLPPREIQRFALTSKGCVFVSETDKRQSNLFTINFNDTVVQALTLPNAPNYIVNDYLEDTAQGHLIVMLNTKPHTSDNVLWLCECDLDGNAQYVIDLPDTGTVRFDNAHIAPLDSARILILGLYVSRTSNEQGSYSLIYGNRHFSTPRLFPAQSAQLTTSLNNEVSTLQGPIFYHNGQYAFVQETFYPEYQHTTTYEFGVPTTEPTFIGYRFLNANVALYDTSGLQLWNYQFPFDNLLVTNLTAHLRVNFGNENILFYYLIGQQLCTMLTNKELQIIDPIRNTTLFANENRSGQMIYTTSLLPWYGPYFMLTGYRFNAKKGKGSTPVYFMHKLEYR